MLLLSQHGKLAMTASQRGSKVVELRSEAAPRGIPNGKVQCLCDGAASSMRFEQTVSQVNDAIAFLGKLRVVRDD